GFDKETGQVLGGLDKLPPDLKEYVEVDNKLFVREIEEWDALQARKLQQEKLALATAAAAASVAAAQPMNTDTCSQGDAAPQHDPEYMEQQSHNGDTKLLQEDTERAISKAAAEHDEKSPEALLTTCSVPTSDVTSDPCPPPEPEQDVCPSSPPAPQRVVEVAIPNVGTFVIKSKEGGYDDEAMMTPNMQGVIMAIGKSRSVYDKSGPEAAFFQALKVEYTRLLHIAQEDATPERDYRLQHVIVYFIHNQAPKKIVERTLLMQFADRNLGFDERCKSIMKVARAKLELIKPDEVNMEEYEMWHRDYRLFRETTVFLLIGLELFLKKSFVEALKYLVYAYQYNKELLVKGPCRGHDEQLIAHYRRECLLKLNEHATALFETGEENEVNAGLSIMNELVVPCIPLLLLDDMEEKDMATEKLTDFLPKLLDCSTEIKSFHEPPKLALYSTLELCERYSRVMSLLSSGRTPADGR
ncbi:hypothetical protein DNTS_022921, partial [Danionella cerebrum]